MVVSLAFAQVGPAGMPAPTPGAWFGSFAPLILIFVVFYVLLILPQQKKVKEHQKMLNNLKKGDRILTNGGLYATIVNLKGNVVEIKLNDEVKVELARSAVSDLVKPPQTTVPVPVTDEPVKPIGK